MTDKPTRRDLLKATASTGVSGTVLSTVAGATSADTIRTVETGLRYELDVKEDFDRRYLDSRPPYTVDTEWQQLVYPNRTPAAVTAAVGQKGALFAERPVGKGAAVEAVPKNRPVRTLPTKLSTRMRPMEGITLASEYRPPQVKVRRNERNPRLVVPSEASIDLSPGTDRELRLSPETVEVQTVRVTDEVVPIEGRPEHRWGPKREYDSVEVEVTPVVDVVDHGELTLQQRTLP